MSFYSSGVLSLKDVWINHLSPFLLPNVWWMSICHRVLLEEFAVRFETQSRFKQTKTEAVVRSNCRIWKDSIERLHIQVWAYGVSDVHMNALHSFGACTSTYVIRLASRSITHCIGRVPGIVDDDSVCAVCGEYRPKCYYFRAVRTNQRFYVCRICGWQKVYYGVLCWKGQSQTYSEVIDE
jgi:hypothetical protein